MPTYSEPFGEDCFKRSSLAFTHCWKASSWPTLTLKPHSSMKFMLANPSMLRRPALGPYSHEPVERSSQTVAAYRRATPRQEVARKARRSAPNASTQPPVDTRVDTRLGWIPAQEVRFVRKCGGDDRIRTGE